MRDHGVGDRQHIRSGVAGVITGLLLGTLLGAGSASAQVSPSSPDAPVQEVRLIDGTAYRGQVVEEDSIRIILETPGGVRVEIARDRIQEFRQAEGRVVQGRFWQRDPNATRLFFTTTGRSLRRGEAYVGTYFLAMPFVAVGVSDRLTLAGGAPLLFGTMEPFYLAPKFQLLDSEGADISLGTLFLRYDDDNVGIAYAVGTFGDPDDAVTLGVGFGYSGSDFSSRPAFMIGAETRVSPGAKMITENYVLPEVGVVLSGGMRLIGERFSADLGIAGTAGHSGGGGCCLPLVNISYFVGR